MNQDDESKVWQENPDKEGSNDVRTADTKSGRPLRPTFLPKRNVDEEEVPGKRQKRPISRNMSWQLMTIRAANH